MTDPAAGTLTWVVGAGGLVGRHVAAACRAAGHEVVTTSVPWDDEDASVEALTRGVERFADQRTGRAWSLAWCAGAGVVATGEDALEAEVRVVRAALAALGATVSPADDGALFLASSAGGLYAGSSVPPFDEATDPHPLVAYGRAKLAMEHEVRDLVAGTGLRAVLGRLANVYGPGQTLGKPQGLLSQLCLAHATGRPLPVFVSMDTIRDYLYAPDAGRMVVRSLELVRREAPGTVVAKVLASGAPVTVGHLVAEARRVFHRPLRTIPVGGRGTGQVLDLRLASRVWPEVDALAATPLPAGLARTGADVLARVVSGGPLDG
ncbi:NAD-dependent epimerase/dehydratase family protein [Oryzobacter telluris]|uniref:NAD-dependent epimerase/dehydratase family protein n=1 Tax=Oryzobacter telluris TaxID=3149179 RepID=UPI00370D0A08